jgi:photosystem II stability/assembly factor-like uncharacterized protein
MEVDMQHSPRRFAFLFVLLLTVPLFADTQADPKANRKEPEKHAGALDPALWKAYEWREIGPYRGGRAAAVTGIPGDAATYYFGATGGGVWKTLDGGRTWKNVSDGFFGGSIGSVAVSAWDPNVVYASGGEVTLRGNVSPGSGLWKSTDAGKSWKRMGLEDAQHIPRIRIHPKNPDLVYAAVLGHAFGPNETRGVYRSKDGGASWQRVLYVNENAGAVDLAMDPTNPRILYATFWRVRRSPSGFESGGPGSGLWKSTDGGDSWTELSRNQGMPKGTLGIIGVTVSPTNPDNLYAIVEAAEGGVFRSKDGGKTWKRTNDDRNLRQRAWYYSRIYADPKDEEVVYVVNVRFHRSKDGGKTFSTIAVPHGDNHDLWIAPEDPLRMIESNDGGVNVSTDGGKTWTPQSNQPTAQLYRVSTDNHFPYRILGAQQDNSAVRILSRSAGPGIGFNDWQITAGGESGYIVADPRNPDVIYGGSYGGFVNRVDHDSGESRDVNAWPEDPMGWGAAELKHRFQWNFPILFSPHDPKTLYAAAEVLFKSTNEGQSWTVISPDLTRNDKSRQIPSGGPITKDNTSIEYYDTIFTVAESPLTAGVIWAGTDDGLVQVTRDGGATWKNVTPKDLPEWAQINSIEASPYGDGGAYVAATRYKSDDFRPYLYKTTDFGATWTRIVDGIDPHHFTRVVRADPERKGLLFAGTEQGMYVSWNDGGRWEPLQLNLPIVPVTDLTIKNGDLVAATQGRGFWVLDGLALLHQVDPAGLQKARLFTPAPAYRMGGGGGDGDGDAGGPSGMGKNPPAGAAIYYWLSDVKPGETVKIEILDKDGKAVRTVTGTAEEKGAEEAQQKPAGEASGVKPQDPAQKPDPGDPEKDPAKKEAEEDEGAKEAKPTAVKGLNQFVWDLRYEKAGKFPGLILWSGNPVQPLVAPGDYQVRLTAGDQTQTAPVRVLADPRSKATPEDVEAQTRFLLEIRDKLDQTHEAIRHVREVRTQLNDLRKRLADDGDKEKAGPVRDAAKALNDKMTQVEEALYQTKNRSRQDPLNFPVRLNDKLNALAASAALGSWRPTDQALQVKSQLVAAIDAELAKLDQIWRQDVPAFNEQARTAGISTVIVPHSSAKIGAR